MIRKARINDLNSVWKLLNSAEELRTTKDYTYSKELVKAYIKNPINFVFVYEEKGRTAGVINGEIWKDKGFAYIANLAVDKKYRRKGIATQLYNYLEDYCRKLGLKGIYALVKISNKKMQKLTKKAGFRKGDSFYYFEKEI